MMSGLKRVRSALLGIGAAAWLAWPAQALEVTVKNRSAEQVALAFSYLDRADGQWVVAGWYNVSPERTVRLDLDSDNEMYYVYSEFSNGRTIGPGQGSVELPVLDRAFCYRQSEPPANPARTVSFLRARASGNQATVRVK